MEEAEPDDAEPASYRSRLADFAAYLGAATVVIAVWLLTPSLFGEDEWGRSAINLAASAASVGLAFGAARLRLSAAADAFSAAALFLLVTGLAVLFAQIGGPRDAALGWLVVSAAAALLGAVLALRVHSPLAAIAAAASIIALPAALAIERSVAQVGRADATLVRTISSFDLWVSLVLVWLVAAALSVSVCRGWLRLPPPLVVWVLAGISLTVAGCLIGIVIEREAVGYDMLLLIGAIVFCRAGALAAQRDLVARERVAADRRYGRRRNRSQPDRPSCPGRLRAGAHVLALSSRLPAGAAASGCGLLGGGGLDRRRDRSVCDRVRRRSRGRSSALSGGWRWSRWGSGPRPRFRLPRVSSRSTGPGSSSLPRRSRRPSPSGIGLLLAGLTIALAAMLWRRRFRLSDRDVAESFPLV